MSFLKKIAKGGGKFLSKVGDAGGKILSKVGKITGALNKATGGALETALVSNPLGAKIKAGYEVAKMGTKTAGGLGKALESGKTKEIIKAGKEAQRSFGRGREIVQNVRRDTEGQPRFGNMDIGFSGIGG